MKKFIVEITETLQRQIEVEAENREEAKHIAFLLYSNDKIVLNGEDFVNAEFIAYTVPAKMLEMER